MNMSFLIVLTSREEADKNVCAHILSSFSEKHTNSQWLTLFRNELFRNSITVGKPLILNSVVYLDLEIISSLPGNFESNIQLKLQDLLLWGSFK